MASMITIRFKSDLSQLNKLDRQVERRIDGSVKKLTTAIVDHMRSNWSPNVPSFPGQPPAVRTGDLDSSMQIEQGRGMAGRFGKSYIIKFTDPATAALEFGYPPNNLAPRPFIRPAMEYYGVRVAEHFTDLFTFLR
jgi:hypothetical protein